MTTVRRRAACRRPVPRRSCGCSRWDCVRPRSVPLALLVGALRAAGLATAGPSLCPFKVLTGLPCPGLRHDPERRGAAARRSWRPRSTSTRSGVPLVWRCSSLAAGGRLGLVAQQPDPVAPAAGLVAARAADGDAGAVGRHRRADAWSGWSGCRSTCGRLDVLTPRAPTGDERPGRRQAASRRTSAPRPRRRRSRSASPAARSSGTSRSRGSA